MPPRAIKGAAFSKDTVAFLRLLAKHRVRYLIVGGEAVIFHGYPRVTGDIDFFYEDSLSNSRRLFAALHEFWDGRIPGLKSVADLREPGVITQFGRPPHRIDLMNRIDGISFATAWSSRIRVRFEADSEPIAVSYLSRRALLKNKRAAGRPKDLDDVRFLAAVTSRKPQRS